MASTPGSYPLTSEDLRALDATSSSFTSEQLRSGYGLGSSFTSDDLLGLTDYVPMGTPSLNITSSTKKGASLSGNYTLWSDTFTCSQPSGGQAPYTYYWEHVSGGSVFGYTNRNSASCQFGRTTIGTDYSGVYRCKVTDGTGASVYSANITIRLVHYDVHEAYIQDVSHSAMTSATAGIYIRRDGTVDKRTGSSYTYLGDWVSPKTSTVGDDFEIYINNDGAVAGDNSNVDSVSPALSTWGTINTDRYAYETQTTVNSTEAAGVRFRIRLRSAVGTNEQTYPIDKSVLLSAFVTAPPPPPWPPTQYIP